jgi:5-hydroxyisourate hydrolase
MGKLTTHVLDTANGVPGAGITVSLVRFDKSGPTELLTIKTNRDGRSDRPLLEGDALKVGVYELKFSAGEYFQARGDKLPEPAFVGDVAIRFGIADASQHYHVPLLVSPWSYSTYRGS